MRERLEMAASIAGFLPIRQKGFSQMVLPLVVSGLAVAAAVWSFSPRPHPEVLQTQVKPDALLVTGLSVQGDHYLAAGEQAHILVAKDPAGPWIAADIKPERASNLIRVLTITDKIAIAAGHDSWIIRTEDGGKTWTEVHFDPERSEPVLGLAGPYEDRLFAVGGFGQFLVSDDLGKSWKRETHEALGDYHLNHLTQLSTGELLLAAERGRLATSSDSGRSWMLLPEIYTGSYFGALALEQGGAIVFGMRGNAFVRVGAGDTWVRSETPGTLSYFGGALEPDGSIVLVGDNDTVVRSRDGGKTFKIVADGGRLRLVDIIPLKGDRWLLAGEAGIELRESNTARRDAL